MKFAIYPICAGLDSRNNLIDADCIVEAINKKNPAFPEKLGGGRLLYMNWREIWDSYRSMSECQAAAEYIDLCNVLEPCNRFPAREGSVYLLTVEDSVAQYLAYQMKE